MFLWSSLSIVEWHRKRKLFRAPILWWIERKSTINHGLARSFTVEGRKRHTILTARVRVADLCAGLLELRLTQFSD